MVYELYIAYNTWYCFVLVVQQPYNKAQTESFDFRTDIDLSGSCLLLYAWPQLSFLCTVCPTDSLCHLRQGQHKELALVCFSTFEQVAFEPIARGLQRLCNVAGTGQVQTTTVKIPASILRKQVIDLPQIESLWCCMA